MGDLLSGLIEDTFGGDTYVQSLFRERSRGSSFIHQGGKLSLGGDTCLTLALEETFFHWERMISV